MRPDRERVIGVVDIGSNTVHLLVGRTNGRSVTPLLDISEGLRLVEDVDYDGELSRPKLQELLTTLGGFKEQAAGIGVDRLHLLATQAIRMAGNKDEVCEAISASTGLPIDILSPEQEAALAFLAADIDCPSVGMQVVVDIGGGSMQVAVGQYGELWDSVSLPLGAARVASHFLPTDPPTYLEEALLVSYLAKVIPPALPLTDANVTGVVGVGGTLRRMPQLLRLKTGQTYPLNAHESLLALLRGRSSAGIAAQFDLKPDRARLLMPAILVLREVMRGYDFPPLVSAASGLREGAILWLARHKDSLK